MADKPFIVATAGHVDHGKSALVRALTGIDPDRLPEEKARGITIDLGFAHLALPAPAPSPDTFRLGIVDVPGHEDFVRNMVSGVGSVDAALFVVAADDGWMPQSEEHLQILTYLGVRGAVVALTKIDLAASPSATVNAVRAALRSSPYEGAPVVPTSTVTGQGLEELKAMLARVLATVPAPLDVNKPRLPIDRVFTLRGIGTVVTGTLTGGKLHRGDALVIQPSGRSAHARALQNHGHDMEEILPGMRAAINVPELSATGEAAVGRGEVVTRSDLGDPSESLDVLLTRSDRRDPFLDSHQSKSATANPLKDGTHVRVYHGSAAWTARVHLLDRRSLPPGGRAIARLRFASPVFALAGDRFIVRDGAERATLAGGVVLDPEPGRRPLRRAAQRRFLERLAVSIDLPDPAEAAAAWLDRDHAIPRAALLRRSPFGAARVTEAVAHLISSRVALDAGEFVVDAAWWTTVRQRAVDLVESWHHEHPEQIGLPLSHLRASMENKVARFGLFDALTAHLTAKGEFIQTGTTIRRASHRPALPASLRAAGERLRAALAAKPFEPPSRRELAPDALSRQALRFLGDTGEAVAFGEDIVMLEENYRRMKTIITRTIRATGAATASELRQVLGTTRRVLIPVLENLDREGITRREGDRRTLR